MFYLSDINQHPWVELKIDDIGRRCNKPTLREDIKQACSNERAFLFLDGHSFFVLKPLLDKQDTLLVWAAFSKKRDACFSYRHCLEGIARSVGGKRLIFYTKRGGFLRTAKKLGYSRLEDNDGYMVWEKQL